MKGYIIFWHWHYHRYVNFVKTIQAIVFATLSLAAGCVDSTSEPYISTDHLESSVGDSFNTAYDAYNIKVIVYNAETEKPLTGERVRISYGRSEYDKYFIARPAGDG